MQGDEEHLYGLESEVSQTWYFSSTQSLIGLQGAADEEGITQLNVIEYKAECQEYVTVGSYNWIDSACISNSEQGLVGNQFLINANNMEQLQSAKFYSDMRIKEVRGCVYQSYNIVANMSFELVANLAFVLETTTNDQTETLEL